MMKIVIWLLIGGGVGAAMGYFGQCTSGTCPLTANWKRGAMVGALMGLVLFFGSGSATSGKDENSAASNVPVVTAADFDSVVLKSEKPVVVDFYASWCGPCKGLAPMLDRLASQHTNRVKVVKVNVDKSQELAQKYNVTGLPTVKFFEGGKETGGFLGLPKQQDLERAFIKLAKPTS
jgi:thioredoxin 1